MSSFRPRKPRKTSQSNQTAGSPAKRDPWREVTDLIIGHLEKGVVPWRCPWRREAGVPRNFHSGKPYRGVNSILLGCRFAASPWWMTYRQALERGGQVKKGETGAMVVKYGTFEKPEEDSSVKARKGMFLRTFSVFNASQIDGVEFPEVIAGPLLPPKARIQKADSIAVGMPQPPLIEEFPGARACYHLSRDKIEMPPYLSFESAETFYLTLYHEIAHATGHPSRLNRASLTGHDGFGGKVYSQEELVAEMCAAFLGMEADIVHDRHEQSAAYLEGWLSVLGAKDHRRWIVQAASHAARAADFVLGRIGNPDDRSLGDPVESGP